jgi:membrane associated rhomboid family serine protease
MFLGMTQADCVTEGVYSYCDSTLWVANSGSFNIADIMALFGHVSVMHLLCNGAALLLFAVPAELLLGRKKFIASVVLVMMAQVIIGELTRTNGLGASAWLMAMPGLMFGASMWKIWEQGEEVGFMSWPTFLFAASVGMVAMDVAAVGDATGVDHMGHISGFLSGLVFVIAGLPFLAMTIRDGFRAWKRERAWRKKRSLMAV